MRPWFPTVLLLGSLLTAGCLRDLRDSALLADAESTVRHARGSGLAIDDAATGLPASNAELVFNLDRLHEDDLSLQEAIEALLAQADIARVSRGSRVFARGDTYYDVVAAQQRVRARLAEFDARIGLQVDSSQLNRPPDSFFGPGLSQPERRDEFAVNLGVLQPLTTGGSFEVAYDPRPGYLYLPGGRTGFNPQHVGELRFELNQPLMRNYGREITIAPLRVTRLSAEQSAWDFKASLMESVVSVVQAYWDLYAARVSLRAYREVVPFVERIVDVQEASLRAHLVIEADVAKARAQLHRYLQEKLERESEVAEAELRLRSLLQVPLADSRQLVPATPPADKALEHNSQEAFRIALDNRPDLVRRRLDIAIRRLELLVARNDLRPDLDFRALYRLNGTGDELGNAITQLAEASYADLELNVSLSLPPGFRRGRADTAAAQIELVREEELLRQDMLSVAAEITNVHRRIVFAFRQYEEANSRLGAAREWVRGARLRFETPRPEDGDRSLVPLLNDFLDALREQTDASAQVASALARYNTALVEFRQAQGTLLDFFAIDFENDPCRQSTGLSADTLPRLRHPVGDAWWADSDSAKSEPVLPPDLASELNASREKVPASDPPLAGLPWLPLVAPTELGGEALDPPGQAPASQVDQRQTPWGRGLPEELGADQPGQ